MTPEQLILDVAAALDPTWPVTARALRETIPHCDTLDEAKDTLRGLSPEQLVVALVVLRQRGGGPL